MTAKPRAAKFAATALTYTELAVKDVMQGKGLTGTGGACLAPKGEKCNREGKCEHLEFECGSCSLGTSTESKGYPKVCMPTER